LRNEKGLYVIIKEILSLARPVKKIVEQNPEVRILFSYNGKTSHALSLKPKLVYDLIDQYGNEQQIQGALQRELENFLNKELSEQVVVSIIEKMQNKNREKLPFGPQLWVLSRIHLTEAKTVIELWEMLQKEMHKIGHRFSKEDCQLYLEVIYSTEEIKSTAPKIILGDTNYTNLSDLLYVPNPITKSWELVISDSSLSKILFLDYEKFYFFHPIFHDESDFECTGVAL
jgi:hypothetical protein